MRHSPHPEPIVQLEGCLQPRFVCFSWKGGVVPFWVRNTFEVTVYLGWVAYAADRNQEALPFQKLKEMILERTLYDP